MYLVLSLLETYVKRTANVFPLRFFGHHDMQSLNNYNFSFSFCNYNFSFFGCVIYQWKVILKNSPTIYYKPLNSKKISWWTKNKATLEFMSFGCPTFFDETCGSWFKG